MGVNFKFGAHNVNESHFRHVLIVHIGTTFNTIRRHVYDLHTIFHMSDSGGSLVIVMKQKAKYRFSHLVVLFTPTPRKLKQKLHTC
jgi:hypothetical protein